MPTTDAPPVAIFPRGADLRRWLRAHHADAVDLWIGFAKKGARTETVTYLEAVDEALCVGWIDGLTRRIDDDLYAVRFTPRRRTSTWSAANVARVRELAAEGRMQPAGQRAFDERDPRRDLPAPEDRVWLELSDQLAAQLATDVKAQRRWEAETPTFRRQAADWVMQARRSETRDRRLDELRRALGADTRPRPFLVTREQRGDASS